MLARPTRKRTQVVSNHCDERAMWWRTVQDSGPTRDVAERAWPRAKSITRGVNFDFASDCNDNTDDHQYFYRCRPDRRSLSSQPAMFNQLAAKLLKTYLRAQALLLSNSSHVRCGSVTRAPVSSNHNCILLLVYSSTTSS